VITSIQNTNNKPNFKAIIKVKVVENGTQVENTKKVQKTAQTLVNILLKIVKGKEYEPPKLWEKNNSLRKLFAQHVTDYFIPDCYSQNKSSVYKRKGLSARSYEHNGDILILTRSDAIPFDETDKALAKISKRKDEKEMRKTKSIRYRMVESQKKFNERIKEGVPTLTIKTYKENGKSVIDDIEFISPIKTKQLKLF